MNLFRTLFRNAGIFLMIVLIVAGNLLPYTVTQGTFPSEASSFGMNIAHATDNDDEDDDEDEEHDQDEQESTHTNKGRRKMVVCHATSSESNPWVRIKVSQNAENGHFDEHGTAQAGHEEDVLLDDVDSVCPDITPRDNDTPETTYEAVCSLDINSYDHVFEFPDHPLLWVAGTTEYTFPFALPAGTYSIALQSYDGYTDRADSAYGPQTNESFFIELVSEGNTVLASSTTPDLADGVDEAEFSGIVDTSVIVATAIDTLNVRHAMHANSQNGDSVHAICAGFIDITPEVENTKPVITVDPEEIELVIGDPIVGNPLIDGVTATDVEDGDLTDDIVTSGSFNPNTIGVYEITYTVTDSAGAISDEAMRVIRVVAEPAPPEDVCEIIIQSDTLTSVLGHGAAVPAWDESPHWTHDIPATWIWASEFTADPINGETQSFTRTFAVTGSVQTAQLSIATDNTYTVYLNGVEVGSDDDADGLPYNFMPGGEDTYDVAGNLIPGVNVISFVVSNWSTVDHTVFQNPAGLLYQLVVQTSPDGQVFGDDACEIPNQKPVITLMGDNPMSIEQNGTFDEPGYVANDYEDGDITPNVVVAGDTVNTGVVGTYTITYNVVDSQGTSADEVAREVQVTSTGSENTPPVITVDPAVLVTNDPTVEKVTQGVIVTDAEDASVILNSVQAQFLREKIDLVFNLLDQTNELSLTSAQMSAITALLDSFGDLDADEAVSTPAQANSIGALLQSFGATEQTAQATATLLLSTGFYSTATDGKAYGFTYDATDSGGLPAESQFRIIVVDTRNVPECNDDIDNDGDGLIDFGEDAGCDSLDDNDENSAPVITVDPSEETISVGSSYNPRHDVTATDTEDGDLTDDIVMDLGGFDVDTPGTYTISYNVTDSQGLVAPEQSRTVTVQNSGGSGNMIPVITVNPAIVNLEQGTTYDPMTGVTATDVEDGDITGDIVIDLGGFDKDVLGTYTITYDVVDSQGSPATQKERMITVTSTGCQENCGGGNNSTPVLTLVGDATIEFFYDEPFTDPGATATDTEDGDLTDDIVKGGNYVRDITGTYTITYNVTDRDGNKAPQISRTLMVKNRPGCAGSNCGGGGGGPVDQAPTLSLEEPNPVQLLVGQNYVEPGYTAIDPEDGDITGNVQVDSSSLNPSVIGEYRIIYTVRDSFGHTVRATRTVIVGDILGTTDIFPQCSLRFTSYMRMGSRSDEVADLQSWLNEEFDARLTLDGVYGQRTHRAVEAYQLQYDRYILDPWRLDRSTGYFYKTSRYMANLLNGCLEDPVFLEDVNITHTITDEQTINQLTSSR